MWLRRNQPIEDGKRIAQLLAGSWRNEPEYQGDDVGLSDRIIRLVTESGSAGLAIERLKQSMASLSDNPDISQMKGTAQLNSLWAKMQHECLTRVSQLLHDCDIPHILFKGPANAMVYAKPELRPVGDLDLCVCQKDIHRAVETLSSKAISRQSPGNDAHTFCMDFGLPHQVCMVDLHASLDKFEIDTTHYLETPDAEYAGEYFPQSHARLLVAEDQLRLNIVHLLIHGGWRPIWLCDVAAMVEDLPPSFNWTRFEAVPAKTRDWIMATIRVSRKMLGTDLSRIPERYQCFPLPKWLPGALYQMWGETLDTHQSRPRISDLLATPSQLTSRNIRNAFRLPNPVRSSFRLGAGVNQLPRLPYQILHAVYSI